MPEAIRILDSLGQQHNLAFDWTIYPWGTEYFLKHGEMMPDNGLDLLQDSDAVFLGAVGDPKVPDYVTLWGLLIPIRRALQQCINLRPIRSFLGVQSPLRSELAFDIDMVIVRENNEGEYSQMGGRLYANTPDELAVQTAVFTRRGVSRIVKVAFDLASQRRGILTSATKSNGIIHTMPFWDEIVEETSRSYPDIAVRSMHIDALCARIVLRPQEFDVIVASNLFGDVLSDLAAGVVGGIGIAPSANIDPSRTHPSMFEPVHGSAPDIVGKGVANPIGQIWSGAMMLRHLREEAAADELERAIFAVLDDGSTLTPDLGGASETCSVTNEILDELRVT
jgi:tartrate dehydrogenase/decarboxylase/D-malate dehydrogenase